MAVLLRRLRPSTILRRSRPIGHSPCKLLPLGEARVAALVGAGLSLAEAAQRLGIAEGTARVVLKRVFSKVGVSRQNELTALLSRMVLR